jgi:hypothetical protein
MIALIVMGDLRGKALELGRSFLLGKFFDRFLNGDGHGERLCYFRLP